MKMKNLEVWNMKEPLQILLMAELPILTSYAVIELIKILEPRQDIIEVARNKLIATHGEPNEKRGGRPSIKSDMKGWVKFSKELGLLYDQEIDVDVEKIIPIKLPVTLNIKPYVLMALEKFVQLDVRIEKLKT